VGDRTTAGAKASAANHGEPEGLGADRLPSVDRAADITFGFDYAVAASRSRPRAPVDEGFRSGCHAWLSDRDHIALDRTAAAALAMRNAPKDRDVTAMGNPDRTRAAFNHAHQLGVQIREFARASAVLNSRDGNRTVQARIAAEFAAVRSASLLHDAVPVTFDATQTRDFRHYREIARGLQFARDLVTALHRAWIDKDPVVAFKTLAAARTVASPRNRAAIDTLRAAALGAAIQRGKQHYLAHPQYFAILTRTLVRANQIDRQHDRAPQTADRWYGKLGK
jgi:hypothetical protein